MHPTPTNHTFTPFDDSSDDEADNLPPPTHAEVPNMDTLPPPQPPPQLQSTTIERQPSPEMRIKPLKSPVKSTSTNRPSTPETPIIPPKSPAAYTSINRQPPPETAITPVAMASSSIPEPHMDDSIKRNSTGNQHSNK